MTRLISLLCLITPLALAQSATMTLERSKAWRQIPLAGYVEAARDTHLVTNRMAEVTELPVRPGSHVRKGTVLIRLEDKAIQQKMAALSQAELAQKSALQQAELQAARMARLLEKGAVAGVQAEQAQLQVAAAKAELEQLDAQRRELKEMAAFLEITAKSDGQLSELNVALGDITQPGRSLGRFVGNEIRTLKVMVPDHIYPSLGQGSWEIQATPGSPWQATNLVAEVPIGEARTSQHRVYLSVPDGLVPNQSIRVRLLLPSDGLFVPEAAITKRGNLTYVMVKGENGIQKRLVRLGLPLPDGRRQVKAGLLEGEVLVLAEKGHD